MRPTVTDRVAWSVGLFVCHSSEPCNNGWTDRDAVWVADVGGPRNHVLDGGPYPHGKGQFWGGMGGRLQSIATLCGELCKNGPKEACIRWGCTLAPPGEYHWTVHMRQRSGPPGIPVLKVKNPPGQPSKFPKIPVVKNTTFLLYIYNNNNNNNNNLICIAPECQRLQRRYLSMLDLYWRYVFS